MDELRNFLRYNNKYSIKINLWDLYGCYRLELFYNAVVIFSVISADFESLVKQTMDKIKTIE